MSSRGKKILALLSSPKNNNDSRSNGNFFMEEQGGDMDQFDIDNIPVITEEEFLLQTQTRSLVLEDCLLSETNPINNLKCDNLKDCIPDVPDTSQEQCTGMDANNVPDLEDCVVTEINTSELDRNSFKSGLDIINADDPSTSHTQLDVLDISNALEHESIYLPHELSSDEENENNSDASYKPPSNIQSDTDRETDVTNNTIENQFIDYENVDEGRKRKNKADEKDWTRIKNKKLRMEGKAYLGFKKEGSKIKQNCQRLRRSLKPACNSSVPM